MNDLSKRLKDLKIVMVSHIFATGAFLDLEEYLKTKVDTLLFIGHPFSFSKEINSFYRLYKKGNVMKKYKGFSWKLPEILLYIKDVIYTGWWVLKQPDTFEYYMAADNFSAFLGLMLQKTRKVKHVVFYTIDYIPKRFKNPFLNFLYHYFDRKCLQNCLIVWNISPRMAQAREKHAGLLEKECVKQIVVPQGIWHKRIPKLVLEKRERYTIIFLGHIVERQGLDLVIESMPKIIKEIPELQFIIIGTGSYEEELKALTRKLKIEEHITFTGFIKEDTVIEEKLSKATIAVAMYKPDSSSLTYFSDPGKIKNYLSAGLPVILTNVPHIAKDIQEKKAAVISDYTIDDFSKKTVSLIKNNAKLNEYSKNAINYASSFDWDNIYTKAMQITLSEAIRVK